MTERTLAQQIKKNCLSKQSAAYVEWATSPAEILETLAGLFGRPSRLIDSLMEPVRRQKRIGLDDWPTLLAYLTVVCNILQEVRRLNQFSLFNNISNVDAIMDKMPTPEIERWLELTAGLDDPKQGQALEKFILERWSHCSIIVSRTTTAERALDAICTGIGGGDNGCDDSSDGGCQQQTLVAAGTAGSKQQARKAAPVAPAAPAGRPAAQPAAFECQVPGCTTLQRHHWFDCMKFKTMDVGAKWALVAAQDYCELCLRHPKSPNSSCGLAKKAGGPPPCGEGGCLAPHHPELHVWSSKLAGICGAIFTIHKSSMVEQHTATEEDKEEKQDELRKELQPEMVEQLPEREQLPEEKELQPDMVEQLSECEQPPKEEEQQPEVEEEMDPIKDVGDMHVRGPSAFSSGDPFILNGEVVSINTSGCAAPALRKIAPIESFVTQIEDENAREDGNKTLFGMF
jgi:hypothetical protein